MIALKPFTALLLLQCTWIITVSSKGLSEMYSSRISDEDRLPHHDRCEPIVIPLCKDIQYNETIMPNLLNHQKQDDAGLEVHQFYPLVKVNCSPDLKIFLCSVYAPVCTIIEKSARAGCEDLMNKFGFQWPDSLDCAKYPKAGPDQLCVGDPKKIHPSESGERHHNHEISPYFTYPTYPNLPIIPNMPNPYDPNTIHQILKNATGKVPGFRQGQGLGFVCPTQLQTPPGLEYKLLFGANITKDCGAPCEGLFFDDKRIKFSRIWVGMWSIFSICYFVISLTYVVGYSMEDKIACDEPFDPPKNQDEFKSSMARTITQNHTGIIQESFKTNLISCNILSGMKMAYLSDGQNTLKWLLHDDAITMTTTISYKKQGQSLCDRRCLLVTLACIHLWNEDTLNAAGLKWGHEAIEANSQYFHVAAWAIPALKTIAYGLCARTSVNYNVKSKIMQLRQKLHITSHITGDFLMSHCKHFYSQLGMIDHCLLSHVGGDIEVRQMVGCRSYIFHYFFSWKALDSRCCLKAWISSTLVKKSAGEDRISGDFLYSNGPVFFFPIHLCIICMYAYYQNAGRIRILLGRSWLKKLNRLISQFVLLWDACESTGFQMTACNLHLKDLTSMVLNKNSSRKELVKETKQIGSATAAAAEELGEYINKTMSSTSFYKYIGIDSLNPAPDNNIIVVVAWSCFKKGTIDKATATAI
ncbi:Frizzled-7-A [Nymphon striatum]|nr:Frizzled-7-A [Nymphon striatum]